MVDLLLTGATFQTILTACLVLLFWRIREVEKVISSKLENGLTTEIAEIKVTLQNIEKRLSE